MRTQLAGKSIFIILVIGAFCAASVALGAHTLSKGHAARIVKTSTTDAKPAQPVARDRATRSDDASAAHDSWKRWPSLTDF